MVKLKTFDYPNAAELNPFIFEIASNINSEKAVSHGQALRLPHVECIKVDGGGILSHLNIHQQGIDKVDKFFKWIEEKLDIKTDMSWIAMYNKNQSGAEHCHMEYNMTFCYYANVPEGSSPLIVEGDEIEPITGRVVAFSGELGHQVPLSKVDGRCSLVGHGS